MKVRGDRRMRAAVAAAVVLASSSLAVVAPAHAELSDNEHITVYFVGPDDQPGRAFAVGPIQGIGTAVDSNYQAGTGGTFTAMTTLSFPRATIVLTMHGVESENFDPTTCIGSFSGEGQFTITGGPPGTTGSGRFTNRGTFFAPRTEEGCAEEGGTEVVVRQMVGSAHAPAL